MMIQQHDNFHMHLIPLCLLSQVVGLVAASVLLPSSQGFVPDPDPDPST